ncbi:MAG: DNA-binding protein WhiA [Bifidobacteriaceae bacterium]|jgi:DNA-binding protein WhiA|nr:DNA-binding protein WhiA [Bifidobacteriaceae bacterium]
MSFTQLVIDEISDISVAEEETKKIIVSVAMRLNGELKAEKKRLIINIHTRSLQFAKKLHSYIKSSFGESSKIFKYPEAKLSNSLEHYIVQHKSKDASLIKKAGLTGKTGLPVKGFSSNIIHAEKQILKHVIATAFICTGKIGDPEKASTVEITTPNSDIAMALDGILKKLGVESKIKTPRGISKVIIKDKYDIAEFLSFSGAINSSEKFLKTYIKVPKIKLKTHNKTSSDINSLKSYRASEIAILKAKRALEILKDENIKNELIQAAKTRIAHPNKSLEKLASCSNPPITKDAIASRLRRLNSLADKRASEKNIPSTADATKNCTFGERK